MAKGKIGMVGAIAIATQENASEANSVANEVRTMANSLVSDASDKKFN